MAGNTVTQYLIRVNVTLDSVGYPTYSYNVSPDPAKSLSVNTGDQVAWYLQLLPRARPSSLPPYRLDFQDPSFFRTASLAVPDGGFSPYLQVRTVKGMTKYTVTVQGVSPADDPQVQTGNFPLASSDVRSRQIGIAWNAAPKSTPTATVDGQAKLFPLKVYPGDVVTFTATQPFDIVVGNAKPNENVPSPFDGSTVIDGSQDTTGPLTVGTDAATYSYPNMYFVLLSDGATQSAMFELDVVPAPVHRKEKKEQ
jgi:hypothetical protein